MNDALTKLSKKEFVSAHEGCANEGVCCRQGAKMPNGVKAVCSLSGLDLDLQS